MPEPVELSAVGVEGIVVEARENDFLDEHVLHDKLRAFTYRDNDRLLERITVDAATDRRKSDGPDIVLEREPEAGPVTRGEQLGFAALAAVPHRSDGVNHVLRR